MIYLDHSATTPVHPQVVEAMLPALQQNFGNPGSSHRFGRDAKAALDRGRAQVAVLLNADPDEIIFTSGGTESNFLILSSWAKAGAAVAKKKIIISATEHPAVMDNAQALARQFSLECVVLPVDCDGVVNPNDIIPHLETAALVSIMMANNETGVMQPIESIGILCRDHEVPFHCDAVQAVAKIPIDLKVLPVDALSLSGHKINGPKGVGALYLRAGTPYRSIPKGGGQERGRRSGTENIPAILGLGKACEVAHQHLKENENLSTLRDYLQEELITQIPGVQVNGGGAPRVPHILNVAIEGVEGSAVAMAMDAEGIAVSTGAACHSGAATASHVLLAMGQDHLRALSAVRISLGRESTQKEIEMAKQTIKKCVSHLRTEGGPCC